MHDFGLELSRGLLILVLVVAFSWLFTLVMDMLSRALHYRRARKVLRSRKTKGEENVETIDRGST
jgi:uncharacterized protein HemY